MTKNKIISFIIGAAVSVQALAGLAASADQDSRIGSLIISVYNEDDGGYFREDMDFQLVGGTECGPGMGGTLFFGGFNTSETNPYIEENFTSHSDYTYTVLYVGKDLDGYNYMLDWSYQEPSFTFDNGANKKVELYMKKSYYIVSSENVSVTTHGQDTVDQRDSVCTAVYSVINSREFMRLNSVQRVNAVDALLEGLCDIGMIKDYRYNDEDKTMEFTYNFGVTGTLKSCVFLGSGNDLNDIQAPRRAAHDINYDGSFAISDLVSLQNWLIKSDKSSYINCQAADFCKDGKIDIFDLLLMKKMLLQKTDLTDAVSYDFEAQYLRTNGHGAEYYPQKAFVTDRAGLDSYIEATKDNYDLRSKKDNPFGSELGFADAAEKYTNEWFETHNLLIVLTQEPSGSNRHEVTELTDKYVNIDRLLPSVGSCDMAQWHILIETDKSFDISDKQFGVVFTEKRTDDTVY